MSPETAVVELGRIRRKHPNVEESASSSLGHRIRVEIRAALHEGPATASQLAEMIEQPTTRVERHIKKMLKDGSIDIAKSEKVGNLRRHYYSVVRLPFFSDAAMAAMTEDERQTVYALIVQAASAEAMASLWAGKIASDRRVFMAWTRVQLDQQGRVELADEEVGSWDRKMGIAARAAIRLAEAGQEGTTYVITSFAYERSRASAPEPLSVTESLAREKKGTPGLRGWGTKRRSLEESVSASLGHRIRVEIRAALHEGAATASQLAKILRQPLNAVDYHLKELLRDGCIEVARTEQGDNNADQTYYSVVQLPYFSDDEMAAMTEDERQPIYAMIVQAASAEALASLWARKIARDPRSFMAWTPIQLDEQGREELADEEAQSWDRKIEIEAQAINRLIKTGENGVTFIITSFGYERSRTSAPEPLDEDVLASRRR
jgi:predicted transcriptional regulator